jgi:hypothetical protein
MKIAIYEKEKPLTDWNIFNLFNPNNESLNKMYKDLSKAINSNEMQSIWQLSKIITRFNLSKNLRS